MFNLKDRTYGNQPALMTTEVAHSVITKVANHCEEHNLEAFTFVFHGGEPLLAKDEFFFRFVTEARHTIRSSTHMRFLLQTNGVLLTRDRARALTDLGIRVGISFDGPAAVHDRHRVNHRGLGSYSRVKAGWDAAVSSGPRPGFLAVLDPAQDVAEAYTHLKSLRPRNADFLFPDSTHDDPPSRSGDSATPFADWLLALFDLWINDEERDFEIRLFTDILKLLLAPTPADGSPKRGYNGTIFIEPDGSIGTLDLLRACAEGMGATSLNVRTCDLDEAFTDPSVLHYYYSNERVSDECLRCRLLQICGGGTLSHRYRASNGFSNRSVYCADLTKLIYGIRSWTLFTLSEELSPGQRQASG